MILKPSKIIQTIDYQVYERKPLIAVAFKRCGYFPYKTHRKLHFVKRESIISLQPDSKYCICTKTQKRIYEKKYFFIRYRCRPFYWSF